MKTFITKKPYFFTISCILLFSGIDAYAELASHSDLQKLPKASDDADYPITLQSNKDNTSFYIDGKFIGVGEDGDLQVLINRKKGHSITAKAPGFHELSPQGIPPNFNYSGINDEIKLRFLYSDKTDYKPPKFAGTEIHIEGGTVYGTVGGGTIENQQIKNEIKSTNQHSSEPRSSSRTSVGSTNSHGKRFESKKALKIISDFASEICGAIPPEGSSSNIELSGEAKASLNDVLKKIADLGIEGAAKYQASEYKGPLQTDLAKILSRTQDCKQNIWNDLKERLLESSTEINERSLRG